MSKLMTMPREDYSKYIYCFVYTDVVTIFIGNKKVAVCERSQINTTGKKIIGFSGLRIKIS